MWLDFDGTITTRDVLDELIGAFAVDSSWREVEEAWQAGKIGSRECLEREFACLRVGPAALAKFLESIPVDPGLLELLALLEQGRKVGTVSYAILSDGIESFIRTILARAGVSPVPVIRSNRVEAVGAESDRLRLICPNPGPEAECKAAHCKCGSARQLSENGRPWIYVGDGRSDLCAALKSDVVFAKGVLARYLEEREKAFIPFETLADVAAILRPALLALTESSGAG